MIQDKAYEQIDRMWRNKVREKEWEEKLELIRQYDNSKFGKPDWYGRRDYVNMGTHEIDARLAEITIEKAQQNG